MSPLLQLTLWRFRAMWREPEALFWTFLFPLITSAALGIAFRKQPVQEATIAVVARSTQRQAEAEGLRAQLDAEEGLKATLLDEGAAKIALRKGDVGVVLYPNDPPELVTDPTRVEGQLARLRVLNALQNFAGRTDKLRVVDSQQTTPGTRYIDFLIPGLLGMNIMFSSVWGLGYALVQMRAGKLLKRFRATPMRRTDFLLSFALSRLAIAVVEIVFFLLYGRLLFGVEVFGSAPMLIGFALLGSLSFAGLSVLIAARPRKTESMNGLGNLVTMPMLFLSGVFFSSSNFPAWLQPVVQLLPLTALNDGMRAVWIDGAAASSLLKPAAVLAAWGVASFALSVRMFRWT